MLSLIDENLKIKHKCRKGWFKLPLPCSPGRDNSLLVLSNYMLPISGSRITRDSKMKATPKFMLVAMLESSLQLGQYIYNQPSVPISIHPSIHPFVLFAWCVCFVFFFWGRRGRWRWRGQKRRVIGS